MLAICALIGTATITTSCSSDDDNNVELQTGNLDAMVGSFKGKITAYQALPGTAEREFFNATIVVTKVGNDKIKVTAKTGEAYSSITEKTIAVMVLPGSKNIASATGDVNGTFVFNGETKSLNLITNKQAAADITFTFEGNKQ